MTISALPFGDFSLPMEVWEDSTRHFTNAAIPLGTFAIGVAGAVLAILTALAACRWISRRMALAREAENRFRVLAEAIPEIVWAALPGSGLEYCNQRLCELTGMSLDQLLGWGWKSALHPDDLPVAMQNWQKGAQTGEPIEAEYRFRTAAGDFRWFLVRAIPLRDSEGRIARWFGSSVDIDNQIRHQQVLEEEVRQHTDALLEANFALESEMRERNLVQQELNEQNERMVKELTERSDRATTLAKMAELLQSCSEIKEIFSVVSGMAPRIFPNLRGAVLLFESSRELLEVVASWADYPLTAPVFGGQDCWALRTGHMHVVEVGDRTALCNHIGAAENPYCCLPLISQGEAIGVLHLQALDQKSLQNSILLHANMFADQVGLSISNLRLREALRNQSIRDPLTGLFNRRYMEETLEREIRRAVRCEQSLGLLLLDLDHFKKFNDTHGHDAGDTVLREAAAFFMRSVRAEDIVCRFGGEEFVIILPMADLKATCARADRIRTKLRELMVLHQGRSLGMVTVSVGVSALPDHGTSRSALLEAADAALYRAKREGRDRVVATDPIEATEPSPLAIGTGVSAK